VPEQGADAVKPPKQRGIRHRLTVLLSISTNDTVLPHWITSRCLSSRR